MQNEISREGRVGVPGGIKIPSNFYGRVYTPLPPEQQHPFFAADQRPVYIFAYRLSQHDYHCSIAIWDKRMAEALQVAMHFEMQLGGDVIRPAPTALYILYLPAPPKIRF